MSQATAHASSSAMVKSSSLRVRIAVSAGVADSASSMLALNCAQVPGR